jgi:hypothetical protein
VKMKGSEVWLCWQVGSTDTFGYRDTTNYVNGVFDSEQEALDTIEANAESDREKYIAQPLMEALAETAQAYRLYRQEDQQFYYVVNIAIYWANALLFALALAIAQLVDGWMSFFTVLIVPVGWFSVTRWFRNMYWQNKTANPETGIKTIYDGFGAAYDAGSEWQRNVSKQPELNKPC